MSDGKPLASLEATLKSVAHIPTPGATIGQSRLRNKSAAAFQPQNATGRSSILPRPNAISAAGLKPRSRSRLCADGTGKSIGRVFTMKLVTFWSIQLGRGGRLRQYGAECSAQFQSPSNLNISINSRASPRYSSAQIMVAGGLCSRHSPQIRSGKGIAAAQLEQTLPVFGKFELHH